MWSRSPGTGRQVELAAEALAAVRRGRRDHRRAGRRRRAALRRLHRLRRAGHPAHPGRAAGPAPGQPGPQPRGRLRARGRDRGRPGADAAAAGHAGDRPDRGARGDRAGLRGPAELRASRRWCTSTAASAAPATWPRWPTARWRSWARAWSATPTAARRRPRRRWRRPASRRSQLREKEGLALINGTDGMLGMLVLAIADLRELLTVADITAAMSVEAPAGHGRGRSPPTCRNCDRIRARRRRRRTCGRCWPAARSWPATAVPSAPGCRTRTRCAAPRRWPARPGTPSTTPRWWPAASWPRRSTTRSSPPTAGWSPTATSTARPLGYVLDFLAIAVADVASMSERRTDRFLDVARSQGLSRVPGGRPGRGLRAHDRPVHPGRHRVRAEAARRAGQRRLDPSSAMQEDHVSMGWSAARKLRRALDGLPRVLAIELLTAAPRHRAARAAGAGARHRRRRGRAADRRPGARPGPVPGARDRGRALSSSPTAARSRATHESRRSAPLTASRVSSNRGSDDRRPAGSWSSARRSAARSAAAGQDPSASPRRIR